ncbi:MAG: hypothetical protein U1E05_20895, partial [Patescibacteria group bacterium]|nr:hypothetical protein [Patescibacteria group bacterium]
NELAAKAIQASVAVVINQTDTTGLRLSITEPKDGYPDVDPTGAAYDLNTGYPTPYDEPLDSNLQATLWGSHLKDNNTHNGFATIHLERLADPRAAHDPVANPYIVVDSSPIALTTVNGVTDLEDNSPHSDVKEQTKNVLLATNERGEHNDGAGVNNLWRQEPIGDGLSAPKVQQSLPLPSVVNPELYWFAEPLHHTLGYLNDPFQDFTASTSTRYRGMPKSPFPWLTWNNRPFVNELELLLVPAVRPSRFLNHPTVRPSPADSPVFGISSATSTNTPYTSNTAVPFPHLSNFFQSTDPLPKLYPVLDFVTVPSRFAGAQHYVSGLTAPDHLKPTYREPGKINLNTIYSERVFRGLMNGFRASDNLWDQFVISRRGYGTSADPAELDSATTLTPTRFARPFRSSTAHELRPTAAAPSVGADREIESTLLRADPTSTETPLFAFDSSDQINDTDRNPYFRHQGLMRLANLTTTRSNVYAVWITVGFFEATPNATITGGYRLGRELGVETGEIKRHRAFYMIDRSIPVGFVRGEDHNVENTIMLQRYIE